jgi:phosphoenolpyruvate carboxykinase (ATP)
LSASSEPEIYNAIRFGAVVENVGMDENSREVDFDDTSITENTRCAYPLHFIPNAKTHAVGKHPTNVILLTCDATGTLPLVAKLTLEQVVYHFASGFTSKVAGTEVGVTEPIVVFSSCFGEPFLVYNPLVYSEMLATKLKEHSVDAWLLNTGWIGTTGKRCPLKYTRAIIDAIHSGELAKVPCTTDGIFGLQFPNSCPGVPSEILSPANNWPDKDAFLKTQTKLAKAFQDNFEKKGFAAKVKPEVLACMPKIPGPPGVL